MKLNTPKIFTLDEARETLPYVKKVVDDLVNLHQKATNIKNKRQDLYLELQKEIDICRQELFLVGCQIKNEKKGLISFFGIKNNKMAEHYWQIGENDIYCWKAIGNKNLNLLPDAFKKIETNLCHQLGHKVRSQ